MALPNKEISLVYRKEVLRKLENILPQSMAVSIQEALYSANTDQFREHLGTLLLQAVSCFDTAGENFYHGLLLGLCATLEPYRCTSNKESGNGRYDIQLCPKKRELPGIIIELKPEKNCSDKELNELAQSALKQMNENDKKYDIELKAAGVHAVIKYGIAFSGKNVAVASEYSENS